MTQKCVIFFGIKNTIYYAIIFYTTSGYKKKSKLFFCWMIWKISSFQEKKQKIYNPEGKKIEAHARWMHSTNSFINEAPGMGNKKACVWRKTASKQKKNSCPDISTSTSPGPLATRVEDLNLALTEVTVSPTGVFSFT